MVLNYRAIVKLSGIIIDLLAGLMLPSLLVSVIYEEEEAISSFIYTILPMFVIGSIIIITVKADFNHLRIRDGFVIVALCWILGSFLGAIPFVLSGYIPNFIDAFFETASGFTTTGSTILTDIEILPKGLLFWRSFTHWIGGMGIIVFAIALLPMLGISGQRIAKAETTGPTFGKLTPKLTESAKILYTIYIGLTILEVVLLMLGGMDLYDSLIHTFGSVGTGGFSNYNASIAHFNSLYIEVVIMVFMILAGTNFTLYYYALRGHWREFFSDSELRCYLLILSGATLLIALNLWLSGTSDSIGQSLRFSAFQSASIMTTTGFGSTDFDLWPTFSKMTLFILMFIGGSSSSTAGGMKVIRILLLFKLIKRGIAVRLHPRAVISIKINEKPIPADTISAVANFFFLYVGIFFIGTLLLSLENYDLETTASAVAACLSNIGPGFNLVGPVLNFSLFSDASTFMLAILMLIGRLELFTIILLFTRQFWNPDK
ncbi:MAG TPA: TrkH family potassium uptake protein [Anaerovoracaceae bacterium]|nr:TrkH family potassium uptake protein [Anaerovoracaceae bacterium]